MTMGNTIDNNENDRYIAFEMSKCCEMEASPQPP